MISRWLQDWCNSDCDSSLGNRGIEFHCGTTSSLWDLKGLKVKLESSCGKYGLLDFHEPLGESGISDSVLNEEWLVDPKETEWCLLSLTALDIATEVEFWVDSDGDLALSSSNTSIDLNDLDPINKESVGEEMNIDGDDWSEIITGLVDSSEWNSHFKETLIHDLLVQVSRTSLASGFKVVECEEEVVLSLSGGWVVTGSDFTWECWFIWSSDGISSGAVYFEVVVGHEDGRV